MKLIQVKKRVKFISDAEGKPVEVVLPYEAYQEYMDMKISLEFYQSLETQESIKRAKEDLVAGRFKDYEDVERLIKDLHG
jgi:PHD/YefM family antitoxin component YafN of YafNO toxin-antitoxin module